MTTETETAEMDAAPHVALKPVVAAIASSNLDSAKPVTTETDQAVMVAVPHAHLKPELRQVRIPVRLQVQTLARHPEQTRHLE